MKYHSLRSVTSALRFSSFKLQFRCASSQKYEVEEQNRTAQAFSQPEARSKKRLLFSPDLPRDKLEVIKLEKLDNVTSVVLALNHVSWAKISARRLSVLNWDACSLPGDFLEDPSENRIVDLAHTIKAKIPDSELYVMETMSYRWTRFPNNISLRSMLVLLLSASNYGAKYPNMVFQKPFILNSAHSLLVGGERTSAKDLLEKKNIFKSSESTDSDQLNSEEKTDCYTLLDIQDEELLCFQNSSKEKQESLSIALLLAITFLDVAVFQNPKTLSKIQKKHHLKMLDC